jgi:hypothetical protein
MPMTEQAIAGEQKNHLRQPAKPLDKNDRSG